MELKVNRDNGGKVVLSSFENHLFSSWWTIWGPGNANEGRKNKPWRYDYIRRCFLAMIGPKIMKGVISFERTLLVFYQKTPFLGKFLLNWLSAQK